MSLAWKWMNDDQNDSTNIEAFGNFFLIEGRQTLDFVQTTILKKLQPICQIDAHNTSIFRLSENDYLCVIADSVMDQAAEITELLTPWLTKAENVYAFKFQSAYLYNTTEKFDKRCFIRTIPTTADHFGFDFIAPMEDCNIVHGVSAGGWLFLVFICHQSEVSIIRIDIFFGGKRIFQLQSNFLCLFSIFFSVNMELH